VCGVWFGNDDYSPLNRMTGGSVPAMTWHDIMEYAHQGVELRNIPGLPPNPVAIGPQIAETRDEAPRPIMLTSRGAQVLQRIEKLMEDAARGLVAQDGLPSGQQSRGPSDQANELASASDGRRAVRGN
jgi:penicillin-binding protein 1A